MTKWTPNKNAFDINRASQLRRNFHKCVSWLCSLATSFLQYYRHLTSVVCVLFFLSIINFRHRQLNPVIQFTTEKSKVIPRPLTTESSRSGRSSPGSIVLSRQRAYTPALQPVALNDVGWIDYTSHAPSDVCFRLTHFLHELLLIYRPRKDERLSWLTYSGQFTHKVVTCLIGTGQGKFAGQRAAFYTTVLRRQLTTTASDITLCSSMSPSTDDASTVATNGTMWQLYVVLMFCILYTL